MEIFKWASSVCVLLAMGGVVHLGGIAFLDQAQGDWNKDHAKALAELGRPGIERQLKHDQEQAVQLASVPKVVDGKSVYANICTACHQANGAGLSGAFPPLAESEWVAKDPRILARIVLGGLQGSIQVKGENYNGAMPSFSQLSDEEIAAVLTYVRSNFGNGASTVQVSVVKAERSSGAVKDGGWTAESVVKQLD
jgi:mono/diheme cytochrome c family protein